MNNNDSRTKAAFHISSDEGIVINNVLSDTEYEKDFPGMLAYSWFTLTSSCCIFPPQQRLKLPEVFFIAFQPHGALTRHCPLLLPVSDRIAAPPAGAAGAPSCCSDAATTTAIAADAALLLLFLLSCYYYYCCCCSAATASVHSLSATRLAF